jgi:hypothetical protein
MNEGWLFVMLVSTLFLTFFLPLLLICRIALHGVKARETIWCRQDVMGMDLGYKPTPFIYKAKA